MTWNALPFEIMNTTNTSEFKINCMNIICYWSLALAKIKFDHEELWLMAIPL